MRKRIVPFVAAAATVVAIGGFVTTASAAQQDQNGFTQYATVHVCWDSSKGTIRRVLSTSDCRTGERKVKWFSAGTPNGVGDRGPAGPRGPAGDDGDDGEDGEDGQDGTDGKDGSDGEDGQDGVFNLQAEALGSDVAIANIGGAINERNTNLGVGFDLAPGKYLISVNGAFESTSNASDPAVDVWPQLSLWIDRNHDGAFQWQASEGDISPNSLMPTVKDRHRSVSGTSVIEVDEETHVGLLAFGYTSTQGSERSGEIKVVDATITATPIGD